MEMFFIDDDNKAAKCDRIDHYWRQLFNMKRGSTLKCTKLSKMALVLPHSNADVERSLSANNTTVTKEKSQLSEESLNGL